MTRLWDRGTALDETIERFTVGRDPELDRQLIAYDALASAAHATMLARIGVLEEAALPGLYRELGLVVEEAREGRFEIVMSDEDGHTALENRLTARLGDVGRRIHTGRSRNDQVIAATRLYGREALIAIGEQLARVVDKLLELAVAERETTFPGYSHTRQAMPSTLGQLFAAHAEGLLDGDPWLRVAYDHLDRSPLGSASGYGVALPLDRELVAELLGFSKVQQNSIAVQNDRGKTEFLVLAAVVAPAVDLGRLATDLIAYSSDELRFIALSPEVTTGSSIMPQKRNPDVLELVRATASRLRARQAEVATIYASLPSGYQRDLQLTKEPFVESLGQARDLFAAMRAALDGISVDRERCKQALLPVTGATDLVYQRVAAGEPFRSAYKAVAADPAAAMAEGGDLREAWRERTHLGAPGALDLGASRRGLAVLSEWLHERREQLDGVWALLFGGGV